MAFSILSTKAIDPIFFSQFASLMHVLAPVSDTSDTTDSSIPGRTERHGK
jgi:hypothetical protein